MSVGGDNTTVCRAFQATVSAFADGPALRSADGRVQWSWNDYAGHVREVAAGLHALGLAAGHALACWLPDSPELHLVDTAALHLRASSFAIHPGCTVEQAEHVLRDSEARIVVAEAAQAMAASEIRARGAAALETIVVVDEGSTASMLTWAELIDCGPVGFDLGRRLGAIRASDPATLIYSFDGAGSPRRAELTHREVASQVAAMAERFGARDGIDAISCVSMTELAGRFVTHYLPIFHGWRVTTVDGSRPIDAVLAEARPDLLQAPRELWEQLRSAMYGRPQTGSALESLGLDRLTVAIAAGACPGELVEFWRALGIALLTLA